MSFPAFYSVVTLLRNAMVISTWLCHTEPLALPSSVCARVLNHHASAHSLPLSFSVGWRGKAFADFQGSLSAYPPSKSVAAPRSKQSAKRRTKESVAGDLVVRMMMIIPAEEIPFTFGMSTLLPGSWLKNGPQNLLYFWALPQGKTLSSSLKKRKKPHETDAFEEK